MFTCVQQMNKKSCWVHAFMFTCVCMACVLWLAAAEALLWDTINCCEVMCMCALTCRFIHAYCSENACIHIHWCVCRMWMMHGSCWNTLMRRWAESYQRKVTGETVSSMMPTALIPGTTSRFTAQQAAAVLCVEFCWRVVILYWKDVLVMHVWAEEFIQFCYSEKKKRMFGELLIFCYHGKQYCALKVMVE